MEMLLSEEITLPCGLRLPNRLSKVRLTIRYLIVLVSERTIGSDGGGDVTIPQSRREIAQSIW